MTEIEQLRVKIQAIWLAASGDGCTSVNRNSPSFSDALEKVNQLRQDRDRLKALLKKGGDAN